MHADAFAFSLAGRAAWAPGQARFRIDVTADLGMDRFTGAGISDIVAARRLTEHLQHYFIEEGQRHA